MDILVFALTVVLLMVLIAACLLPVGADSPEDQGDGMTEVVIPGHVRTPRRRPRTLVFFGVTAGLSLVFLTVRSLPALYTTAVGNVADAITRDPATVNGYLARLRSALVFFGVAYIAGTAAVLRANLGRRLAVLGHGVLYLAMSILAQALMITIGIASGWLVAPFGIEATLANLLIGGLVVMRLTFTTFVLPRATTLPMVRRPRCWDTVLTCCALVTVVTVLIAGYAYISEQSNLNSVLQVFLPLYAVSMLFIFMFAPLWLLWWVHRKLPEPGPYRPPVDIIIPAYNETDNIARLLRSVDVAAARYGGPVRVVVSNDGSIDDTAQVAEDEIGNFRHARGRVLTGPNRRQSAALNRAIAATSAEIIIRVDADCVLGEDTLVYAVPWFEDPDIGCVGAMEEPRTDTVTWFHRMRVLETAFQFRFARLGQSLVDGITVIPGTFTAMRRGPVAEAGGFPVGMNGEDSDITMQIGRLGYRVVVRPADPVLRGRAPQPRRVRRAAHPLGPGRLPRIRPARAPAERIGGPPGVPAPPGHPGGGHLAARPALPGPRQVWSSAGGAGHEDRRAQCRRAGRRPVRGGPAESRKSGADPYPSRPAAPRGRLSSGPRRVPSRVLGRCRPGRASATVSSCSAFTECALSTASQYGQAAAIPPASGRYCSLLVRGLTQMIRCATRESRCIWCRSTAGSPVSQPSEMITTTAPRARPGRPTVSLNSFSEAPMRVPPSQSGAACPARRRACSGGICARAPVSLVSRVANVNTSASAPPAAQYSNWSMARA